MNGQWKPGDVVTATVNGRPNVRVIAGWSKYDPQLRWAELSTRWADGDDDDCWFMPVQVTDHRPLVVIDPEDREQAERLTGALVYAGAGKNDTNHWPEVQAALREFANPTPPKPEEPTGLGAVVRDSEGLQWVRATFADADHYGWRCANRPQVNGLSRWPELDAIKVLSEGVTN